MTKIKILPTEVVAQIAAGEVVERPATIIKELVENSLDAGATKLSVSLENSGLSKIIVTDNGEGMSQADVVLAPHRHATSKIKSVSDLEKVVTFGFRGEALASIAQVSHLTIKSRPSDQAHGYQVSVANGHLPPAAEPVGMPVGTSISVTDLFLHQPVRQQFLKSKTNELRKIISVLTEIALVHPQLSLTVTHDRQPLFQVAAQADTLSRFASLVGISDTATLIPVHFQHSAFSLRGFLGTPQLAQKSQRHQFIFVNQRPISFTNLSKLVKESFGSLLEPLAQPLFVFFLTLPPETIDVNIHPRKETIRLSQETTVLEAISHHLKQLLNEFDLTYKQQHHPLILKDTQPGHDHDHFLSTKKVLQQTTPAWKPGKVKKDAEILQLHHTYLVLETKTGIIAIDQHAAHERILYEQFNQSLTQSTSPETVRLATPHVLNYPTDIFLLLEEHMPELQKLGFDIEIFGNDTVKISEVPSLIKNRDLKKVMDEIISDLVENRPLTLVNHRVAAYLACRSAIKAGDFMTPEQRHSLVSKLLETPNRFTCPHGRPTMITISTSELETWFKRKK